MTDPRPRRDWENREASVRAGLSRLGGSVQLPMGTQPKERNPIGQNFILLKMAVNTRVLVWICPQDLCSIRYKRFHSPG